LEKITSYIKTKEVINMSTNWEYAKASSEIADLGGLEAFKKFHFNRGVISSSKVWAPATIAIGIAATLVTTAYQKQKAAKEQKQLLEDRAQEIEKALKNYARFNEQMQIEEVTNNE
jgi:hypothetical protein